MRFLVLISLLKDSEDQVNVSLLGLGWPNAQHREDPHRPLPHGLLPISARRAIWVIWAI
jgi:hypothetical protein